MKPLARQRAATVAVWRADVATRPHGAWAELGGLALHATGLHVRQWNGAHVTSPQGLSHLGTAHSWFAGRGLPWGLVVPSELGLEPPGCRHLLDQPLMLMPLTALPEEPALDLRWDPPAEHVWRLQSEAFGDPAAVARDFVVPKLVNGACSVVVAYDGGVPVATATGVHVDGVVGVYGVGTAVAARRQGWGRAVTLAVLHEAVRRGCDLAFLNPSESGYGVYAALGFVDAAPWRIWAPD